MPRGCHSGQRNGQPASQTPCVTRADARTRFGVGQACRRMVFLEVVWVRHLGRHSVRHSVRRLSGCYVGTSSPRFRVRYLFLLIFLQLGLVRRRLSAWSVAEYCFSDTWQVAVVMTKPYPGSTDDGESASPKTHGDGWSWSSDFGRRFGETPSPSCPVLFVAGSHLRMA